MTKNNIKHILMADKSIILQLSTGPKTITPRSFNYNKIVKLLPTTEEELLPLLQTPPLPNGIFYFYLDDHDKYWVTIIHKDTSNLLLRNSNFIHTRGFPTKHRELLGTYASIDDIKFDFPELFI